MSSHPFPLPALRVIQLERAFSLVRCEQHQDVVELCDKLLESCQAHVCDQQEMEFHEIGAFDLSLDADFDVNPKTDFTPSTPAPNDLGVWGKFKLLILAPNRKLVETETESDLSKTNSKVQFKRQRCEEPSEPTATDTECLQWILTGAHLYKAEGLAGAQTPKTALACIDWYVSV